MNQYGEFATTYRPREKCGESKRQKEKGPIANIVFQSANDALKNALNNALKESGKSGVDDVVTKIMLVYEKIAEPPRTSLSAIAQELGLSERVVDEYIVILKNAGVLRRKDGKRFGVWETLM